MSFFHCCGCNQGLCADESGYNEIENTDGFSYCCDECYENRDAKDLEE